MSKTVLKRASYFLVSFVLIFSLMTFFVYDNEAVLNFNLVSAITVFVILLGLCVAEKKYGYFSMIFSGIRNERKFFVDLSKSNKRFLSFLHGVNLAVTISYVAAVVALIMLGHYSKVSILCVFWGSVLAIALQLLDRILTGKGMEHARLFVLVTVLAGLMMCYTIPTTIYVSWDDETHFRRAYDLLHLFDNERPWGISRILVYNGLPVDKYIADPQAFVQEMVYHGLEEVEFAPRLCNPYNAFAYLPMMAVMTLFSLIGSDVVTLVVACRLINVLVYAGIVYSGIRRLKSGATIFSAVCLMPCALYLACSINYDFWLTAWVAYAFAYTISILQDPEKKFCKMDFIMILGAFFLGCGPKAIYCAMILPMLLIPNEKFESKDQAKRFRVWTLLVIGLIVATLLIPGLIVPDIYTDHRGGENVSSAGQISFILSNPFRYAHILLRFLSEFCSFSQFNTWSGYFAYLGNPHMAFGSFACLLLVFCTFTDRGKDGNHYEKMQWIRWGTLFVAFVQLVLVATALYVGFTPIGSETVNGVSYRYIFPLLAPICFFLAPAKLKCEINPKLQSALVYGGLALTVLFAFFNSYIGKFSL